jgi:H+/Cl- antiporter ClcA
VLLAAVATIGLGLVLGPEAPLLALGGGIAGFLTSLPRRTMPDQGKQVLAAAAAATSCGRSHWQSSLPSRHSW